MFFFITSSHSFFYSSQIVGENNFSEPDCWRGAGWGGEFVREDVGAMQGLGWCWLGQCWLGYKIHSLWREVLEGWKGEEVREGS